MPKKFSQVAQIFTKKSKRNEDHTAISRKVVEKKHQFKVHTTRPKGGLGIHWNFAYWPRRNLPVCIFARGEFVFPLRRPYL